MGYSYADTNAGAFADFDAIEVSDYSHVFDRVSVSTHHSPGTYPKKHANIILFMALELPALAFTA